MANRHIKKCSRARDLAQWQRTYLACKHKVLNSIFSNKKTKQKNAQHTNYQGNIIITIMFITTLFIAKKQKQPKCSSADEI